MTTGAPSSSAGTSTARTSTRSRSWSSSADREALIPAVRRAVTALRIGVVVAVVPSCAILSKQVWRLRKQYEDYSRQSRLNAEEPGFFAGGDRGWWEKDFLP